MTKNNLKKTYLTFVTVVIILSRASYSIIIYLFAENKTHIVNLIFVEFQFKKHVTYTKPRRYLGRCGRKSKCVLACKRALSLT